MLSPIVNIIITLLTFVIMEGVTWCTHKFIMHGLLWNLHEDHHQPDHSHFLEKNDLFFVIFSVPSITMLFVGTFVESFHYLFFIGLGIMLYGFAYFVVHDIIIHQRFKLFTRSKNFYVLAIRKAHKVHHKNLYKEESQCFGMLFVPLKYFREAIKSTQNA